MANFFKRITVYTAVLIFMANNAACPAFEDDNALRVKSSAGSMTSREIEDRFLNDDIQGGEDGIAFIEWTKRPNALASGTYAALDRVSSALTDQETAILNSKLKKIKHALLREGFLGKEDFSVSVKVVYPAYKSATYDRKSDTIILDRRSFENEDFLYLVIKHELTDRKLPSMQIIGQQFRQYPGLRELFTLLTVNIRGFMDLRNNNMQSAQDMLSHYGSMVHYNNGLFRCYENIIKDPSLNDPFAFTEDIFRIIESEQNKVYFPNMREAVRQLAIRHIDNSINYKLTSSILRTRLRSIEARLAEMQAIKDRPKLMPLADFKAKIPASLRPFMPYAQYIDYSLDGDCMFLRIRLSDNQADMRFAYIYIGLNDNWDSALGRHGKIFNLTYDKWQAKAPGIFKYRHDGVEKDRSLYWGRLIRMPVTELINHMYNSSSRDKIRELFHKLFNELGIRDRTSQRTWLSIKNLLGRKKAPGGYYVIENIIWEHIDRIYPKLFLGEHNLRYMPLADIPVWLIMEDSDIGLKSLSWLNPQNNYQVLDLYYQANRSSMRDILDTLRRIGSSGRDFHVSPKSLDAHNMQAIHSAIHVAA